MSVGGPSGSSDKITETTGTEGGPVLPAWLRNMGSAGKSLLKDPRAFIVGVLADLVVDGTLNWTAAVLDLILETFALVAEVPGIVTSPLLGLGSAVGGAVLMPLEVVVSLYQSLLGAAGPLAPVVGVLTFAGLYLVATRVGGVVVSLVSPRLAVLLSLLDPRGWLPWT